MAMNYEASENWTLDNQQASENYYEGGCFVLRNYDTNCQSWPLRSATAIKRTDEEMSDFE